MRIKKSVLITGAVSGIALASVIGGGAVFAQNTAASGNDSIVDKIAQKFNLNKNDVKAVFEQDRSEHEAQRQQKTEDKLSKAVTDKKITSDQKDKILAKQKELKTFMHSLQDKTHEERQTAMKAKRTELEKWAMDNNIPKQYLRFVGGQGHRGGFGGPGAKDNDNEANGNKINTGTSANDISATTPIQE